MNKEQRYKYRVGLAFGGWLTDYNLYLVKWDIYRNKKV